MPKIEKPRTEKETRDQRAGSPQPPVAAARTLPQ
jgi:hypothetical protein